MDIFDNDAIEEMDTDRELEKPGLTPRSAPKPTP